MDGVHGGQSDHSDRAAELASAADDAAVDAAVAAIDDALSEGVLDWDVSTGDLRNIKSTLEALPPAQLNEVIEGLSDESLAKWGAELNGTIGGLSATERADQFVQLAQNVSGSGLARIFENLTGAHQQEFVAAINAHSGGETRADFVDATQREALNAALQTPEGLTDAQKTLLLDLGQLALDVVGLADPTPISDGANGLISLFRGDFLGAGLSAVSMIPYLGDAAKLGKLGKWAETVAGVVELAAKNADFARAAEPLLKRIDDAIGAIPDSVMRNLPESAQNTLQSMSRQIDEVIGGVARSADAPLVINSNVGSRAVIDGRTVTIGDAPTVRVNADGTRVAVGADGAENTIRQPRTYDSAVQQADGSTVYTKNNQSVTYDANGFPVFNAKADIYLEPRHIGSGSDADHFRAANEAMRDALRGDPALADRLGLNEAQVQHLMADTVSSRPPPDMTWHHHQDTGRIQLVDRAEHNLFRGGHVGGMAIWGGGR
ncbi:MAG: HNH endonuclease [Pseudomonadota bacterium]